MTGTIVAVRKSLLNRNQLNEVREAENVLTVEIIWKDLRTGKILVDITNVASQEAGPTVGVMQYLNLRFGEPPSLNFPPQLLDPLVQAKLLHRVLLGLDEVGVERGDHGVGSVVDPPAALVTL